MLAFTRMEGEAKFGLRLSESDDHGRTWDRARTLMKAGQWPFDVTQLKSGHLLLSYGSRVEHSGGESSLARTMAKPGTWNTAC